MKHLRLLILFVLLFGEMLRADSVTIAWDLPVGAVTAATTNAVTFEGATNTVTIYPDYTGFNIYYSSVLTIANLPNGNKFLCVTSTNLIGVESTPSNLVKVSGNSLKVPNLIAR